MLEPQSRRLLLESLQPPEGCRLDWAVGTTYSLDLLALLSAPVAFAFSDCQDGDGRPVMEPLALLKAVRQYADRTCLFCQAGKIHVPRTYQPLLADLEDSIVEANAPRGGSFHPKLWFLRYVAGDGAVQFRFLCLSRNMTFDRCWDTVVCLEGQLRERTNAFARNHDLGRFVDALPEMVAAPRKLAPVWQKRIKQLAHEIRRVEFEVPSPFEDLQFWPLGIGAGEDWPFSGRMDKLLVVAPFVDAGFLKSLGESSGPMQLVSRPECLARLKKEDLAAFEEVWVLDETAEAESGDAEEESPHPEGDERKPAAATCVGEIPLVGLHAKLYVADSGWDAHVWSGSANATKAAFAKNVEFLVEMRGRKSKCGVNAILGQAQEEKEKENRQAACLADLLIPYKHQECSTDELMEQEAFSRMMDRLARQLVSAGPLAFCELIPESTSYALVLRSERVIRLEMPKAKLRARPISLQEPFFKDLCFEEWEWGRFEPVSLIGLTSFFAFELTSGDERFSGQFVLNIPLQNAPENRRENILRHLLSDRERVLRFLLLLLIDSDASDFGRWVQPTEGGDGKAGFFGGMFQGTLFESLMRALDRDPLRIDQVAQIIEDLGKTAEGQKLLPENLQAVWEPIWKVRQRQLAHQREKGKAGQGRRRGKDA
jgi:hypothetical protein